jgi:hypothetical protein
MGLETDVMLNAHDVRSGSKGNISAVIKTDSPSLLQVLLLDEGGINVISGYCTRHYREHGPEVIRALHFIGAEHTSISNQFNAHNGNDTTLG